MPGENNAIVGCSFNRPMKSIGISKITTTLKEEWRVYWLSQVTKSIVLPPDLKLQLKRDEYLFVKSILNRWK